MTSTARRSRATHLGAVGFAAVAVACAAFAAYLARMMLQSEGYAGTDRLRPVVVAKRSLPAAQPLTEADVELAAWPEKHLPPGAFSELEALLAGSRPPRTATAILQGEPIVAARLASADRGTGLAALVTTGRRAVAVKVDDTIARSRLVYPGAHVDVLATIRDPEGRGPSTRVAVEDVRVLAVEDELDVETRRTRDSEEGPGSPLVGMVVTLEVTPQDAEVVGLAAREGRIDLALRGGSDRAPVDTPGATPSAFSAFADDERAGPPARRAAPSKHARGGRGGKRLELRAVDHPDAQARRREIETYHAR